jgi:FAD:protein FMN transferase
MQKKTVLSLVKQFPKIPVWFVLGGLFFLTLTAQSGASSSQVKLIQRAAYSMGTVFKVRIYHDSQILAEQAAEAALAIIREQDQSLSDWLPDSELNVAITAAWPKPAPISEGLYQALKKAKELSLITQGAFDISVGPLLPLWGFRGGPLRVPSQAEIQQTLLKIGSEKFELFNNPPRLALKVAGMGLDFGALGKGWALDLAAEDLRKKGIQIAALSCDSSSIFLGTPPGSERGWPVGVRHPRNPEQIIDTLFLKDQALSSSGDDQQYFELEGTRYSHIIDPRTGWPAVYSGSMTVIAPSAALADALSTALLILPKQETHTLALKFEIQALHIWSQSEKWQKRWYPIISSDKSSNSF